MKQKTLSIIKPDAVERNLTDNIKEILLKNNLKILKEKKIQITKDEAAEFYKVHQTKPFYDRLCDYLSSGIIVVMILEGENSIKVYREIMGSTDPKSAKNLSIKILQYINLNKNVRNKMSINARNSVIKDFNSDKIRLEYINIIRSI